MLSVSAEGATSVPGRSGLVWVAATVLCVRHVSCAEDGRWRLI